MIKSTSQPQKVLYASPCTTLDGQRGITLSFTRDKNVTLLQRDSIKLFQKLCDALGNSGAIFTKMTPKGLGDSTIGPSPKGVSIASMPCPIYGDPEVTLEFLACDGTVTAVEMAYSEKDRLAMRKEARQLSR